ncbi:MAG TPA: hypothetical protein DCZ01_11940 [Elusimicrobia bacterium]|nr:MAG: hypothetical protein A2X37_09000 [Elusimicrobia bacterium GWA2_66_18]OGR71757.1 MAG: hypothetical protein A2X40_05375 [Elusimicrobia bacterium GWC2_65_9]HAZ09201.1 hypothetical protein [Elusimicrobiota bacterium]
MALIRPALLAALVYLGYVVAFPDYTGALYHVMVPACIAGGVTGLWLLRKLLDLSNGALKLGIEAAFLAAVAVFIGYTMPQKSGKPPLTQWAEGARPTQSAARRGLERLRVDPDGAAASKLVDLFPKR